jgi:cell filamentation protein
LALAEKPDPYCYPNSSVLQNNFDIRDEGELKATEARVAAIALFALQDEPLQGPANEERLKATHRAIFQNIYDWAGTYRQNVGTMTKGRAGGYQVTYGNSQFVPEEMARIFRELTSEDYLRELEPDQFASRLAYFYGEIDSTHPFRDGNSRTLRQFSSDLALNAGYELDWESTGLTEESRSALYLARDRAFAQRNYAALTAIIRENLTPLQP